MADQNSVISQNMKDMFANMYGIAPKRDITSNMKDMFVNMLTNTRFSTTFVIDKNEVKGMEINNYMLLQIYSVRLCRLKSSLNKFNPIIIKKEGDLYLLLFENYISEEIIIQSLENDGLAVNRYLRYRNVYISDLLTIMFTFGNITLTIKEYNQD